MKPLLSCLLFCFALFYSASSGAYNEAMCILIKQEIQQHSHNKASRKYRNAARDFEKNCTNPPAVNTQPALKLQPVIEQPPSEFVNPPVTKPVSVMPSENTKQTKNNTTAALTTAKPDESHVTPTAVVEQNTSAVKNEQPNKTPASVLSKAEKNTPAEVKTTTVEPALTAVPMTIKASEQSAVIASSTAKESSIMALVLSSVTLLLVVLITVAVLIRLRNIKQNKQSANSSVPLHASAPIKRENNQSHTNKTALSLAPPDQPNTTAESPSTISNTSEIGTVKVKPEPNTAEFEAAAKATLERIKNAAEFAEPQIRDYDPHAKQTKIKRNPVEQTSEPVIAIKNEVPITSSQVTPEPITPAQPKVDLHTPKKQRPLLNTITEHDFKEPEVRTFDPNAPLKAKKTSLEAEQVKAAPIVPSKPDNAQQSSNPFANLSLDESWDPNSPEKPKIEKKQRAPKSQALIDAEERAKNMQTKE